METKNVRFRQVILWGIPLVLVVLIVLSYFSESQRLLGWKTYTSSNSGLVFDSVTSFAFDQEGRTWIGTYQGLNVLNEDDWDAYTTSNSGLTNNEILSLAIDPTGAVWIGTDGAGVVVFDGETWTSYTEANSELVGSDIKALAIDPNGNVWAGTDGNGINFFDGNRWVNYQVEDSPGLNRNYIEDIAIAPDGKVWVVQATNHYEDAGISVFDGENWSTVRTNPLYRFSSIAIAPNGIVWAGTMNHGVGFYAVNRWRNHRAGSSELISDQIEDICIDPKGQVWVATFARGISVFDGTAWRSDLAAKSGRVTDFVKVIAADPDGNIFIGGSHRGVGVLNPEQKITVSLPQSTLRDYLYAPVSIFYTGYVLILLWVIVIHDVKPALVGIGGWVLSLILFGPPVFPFHYIPSESYFLNPAFFTSALGTLGALGFSLLSNTNPIRKKKMFLGMWIGLALGFVISIIIAFMWMIAGIMQ